MADTAKGLGEGQGFPTRSLGVDEPGAAKVGGAPGPERAQAAAGELPDRIRGAALRRSLYFTTVGWMFGAFWFSATSGATINRFTEYLAPASQKDLILALVTAAALIGVLFQIPGALMIEHLGRRKKFFIRWVTLMRVLFLVLALMPWFLPKGTALGGWLLVSVLMIAWCVGQYGGQAWVNWMADLVPPRVRGKYFGRRSRIGIAVMAGTGILMGLVLDVTEQGWFQSAVGPWSGRFGMTPLMLLISVIFLVAAVAGIMDIQVFHKVDEPRMSRISTEPVVERLLKPFRDREFVRYIGYLSLFNFSSFFCQWMWWPYLLLFFDELKSKGSTVWWLHYYYLAAYIMLPVGYNLGQFAGYPVWGGMIDRFGRKPIIFISSFCHTFSWVFWLFLSPAILPWAIGAQLLGGFFGSGQEIANFNMILGFNRKGGAGYQAVATVIISVSAAVAATLSGLLAKLLLPLDMDPSHPAVFTLHGMDFNRYRVIIIIGIALKFLADLVLLTEVREPAAKPRREAVRFLIENLYGNLNSVIFTPIRSLPEATGDAVRKIGDVAEGAVDGVRKLFR